MPRRLHTLLAFTALALSAGCGTHGPATPAHSYAGASSLKVQPQAARPLQAPGAPTSPAAIEGLALLNKERQALTAATGFSAEVMSTTEGHWKQGEHTDELRHVSQGFRLVWAKPARFRGVVFNAPTPLMEGATLVTEDGVNVTARAQGLLSIIPIHAKANDPRIANARNHTFDKFAPGTQMQRLMGASAVWTILDKQPGPSGAPIVRVRVDNVPRLDAEIDEEIMAIDMGNNAMKTMTGLVKGHPVVTYTFQKFAWNPKVTSDMFKL